MRTLQGQVRASPEWCWVASGPCNRRARLRSSRAEPEGLGSGGRSRWHRRGCHGLWSWPAWQVPPVRGREWVHGPPVTVSALHSVDRDDGKLAF